MPTECSAPRSHVAFDPDGRVYPCVPLMTLERDGLRWEDYRRNGFELGPKTQEEVCSHCWWNCHRELDLSLGLLRLPHRGPSIRHTFA